MCATIVVVTGGVTIASAQDNRDANANELLDVGLSVIGAYDSDTNTDLPFLGSGQLQPAGPSAWGVGSLNYIRRSARAVLQTSAESALRYLTDLQEFHSVMHSGAVSLSAALPKRFGLQASAALAYSPSYLYGLFPTLPSTSAVEPLAGYADPYDVDASSSYSANSSISLDRRVGRRSSVSVFADFTHTNFSNETPTDIPTDIPTEILTRPDLTVFSLGARFSRNVTRDTALSAGYRYNTGEFGYRLGQTTGEHAVDFGFNTTRRVSATRRIDLSASVGGSVVEIPEGAVEFGAVPRQYRLNAEASASYPLSRTARLRGVYTRGLQYVGGLSRPVFVDGFSGELNGRVFGRIDIFGRIGRAAGQPVGTSDDLLDTYTSQLKITYLVTREFSAYAEYIHYEYEDNGEFLPAQIPLVPGLPPDLKREAIHVGLAWQLPLLRR